MKAYISIKYLPDSSNKNLIEELSGALYSGGFKSVIMQRDYEDWGKIKFSPEELMNLTFEIIDDVDLVVVELSEKGVGIGIETGYAYAKNIPIVVIAKEGSDISDTLRGIAKKVIFYKTPEDLVADFKNLKF